jgi:hypothetical protein
MKNFVLFLFTCMSISTLASPGDTMVVVCEHFSYEWHYVTIGRCDIVNGEIVLGSTTAGGYEKVVQALKANPYCIFVSKRRRKIMEGHWNGETMSGHYIAYRRNGAVKVATTMYQGKPTGQYMKYRRRGKVKRHKYYPVNPVVVR